MGGPVKKLAVLPALLLLLATPVRADTTANFVLNDPSQVTILVVSQIKTRMYYRCHTQRTGTSYTFEFLEIPYSQTGTYMYHSTKNCHGIDIMGLGFELSPTYSNIKGDYIYQLGFSFNVGYNGPTLNPVRTETSGSDYEYYQSTNLGDFPNVITGGQNFFGAPISYNLRTWTNAGFPSQMRTIPISSKIEEVTSNPAYQQYTSSGTNAVYATRTFNYTAMGRLQDLSDVQGDVGQTNGKISILYGLSYDEPGGLTMLSIDQDTQWSFSLQKGVITIAPESAYSNSNSDIVSTLQQTNTTIQDQTTTLQNSQQLTTNAVNQNTIAVQNMQRQDYQQHQEVMNSDTTTAQSTIEDYMTSFDAAEDQTLSSIITAPLRLAQATVSESCHPLVLPLPIVNSNITLPCPRQKMEEHFPQLLLLYDLVTTGLISYAIGAHLFKIMEKAKNPDNAGSVEIMEL